jgi:hypothetical protein
VCLELEEVAILELGIVEKGELSDKQVMGMVSRRATLEEVVSGRLSQRNAFFDF